MDSGIPTPEDVENLTIDNLGKAEYPSTFNQRKSLYVEDDTKVMVYASTKQLTPYFRRNVPPPMFEMAGPRPVMFFEPSELTCGIVTCGGLCPGLNDVIRTVYLTLHWQYGVPKVYGFRYGYEGLTPNAKENPLLLSPELVDEIQHRGGTILGSSRGPQDPVVMVDTLLKYRVQILFAIGGDGTFAGAHAIAQEIKKRGLKISIIGIPKTIDNDIFCSEKTFGFSTAVQESLAAIQSAHEEAKAAWNGIGLVKLMGRDSGFIAANATLANSDVNFCLIPEASFTLEGHQGFLPMLEARLRKRRHAVVVVAEGAGQNLFEDDEKSRITDPSGNVIHRDIGLFLKDKILEYFKKKGMQVTLKYIDPSYTIRSCPANASDSAFCLLLGQHAVHAGMAGKTDMFVGYWNHHFVHVPLTVAVGKRKQVDLNGELWQTVIAMTG